MLGMRAHIVIPVLASILILGTLGLSQDVHAVSGTLDGSTCSSVFGGTWDGVDTCTTNSLLIFSGVVTIPNGINLVETNSLFTEAGSTIDNFGTITSTFTIQNHGTFNNHGTLNIELFFSNLSTGILNNFGTINNNFQFSNFAGGIVNNFGDINNSRVISNQSTFNNSGTIINDCTGTIIGQVAITGNEPITSCGINESPTVGAITTSAFIVKLGDPVTTTASFLDSDLTDTHTAQWDWGDGTIDSGTVTQGAGSGSVNDSHVYNEIGVFTIQLTVTDNAGGFATQELQFVIVFDPNGGFVTGGGWIDSPSGAYYQDGSPTELTGKANFGFVSKYKKGASIPTGVTEFQFKVADLNFHSDSYDWLVIAGHKAMYKGVGTINGAGNFGFMLSAIDEKLTPSTVTDLFRIKIVDKDTDTLVYDNQINEVDDNADPTTAISGGSIVIHKAK